MCTMIVATRVEGAPELFVIHNRDEQKARPAGPPALLTRGDRKILAPRDEEAGGTWLGLNDAFVFAGITNRFGMPSREEHRTRGELVFRVLEAGSAREGVERISRLRPGDYNGFHLLAADRESAEVIWSDGAVFHRLTLEPGFYLLTERSFQRAPSKRIDGLSERILREEGWTKETEGRLKGWMAESDRESPLEGACIDLKSMDYGTRSSTLVELRGPRARFLHAQGPPCEVEYKLYSTPFA